MDLEKVFDRFRLTPDDVATQLAGQDHKCAVCKRDLPPTMATVGDHDHKTGLFRGFLCFLCNRALGVFFDDVRRLEAAVAYLKDPPAPHIIGERYGMIGRKVKAIPTAKKGKFFTDARATVTGGAQYRCGCIDTSTRQSKVCPRHGQPRTEGRE